MKSFTERVKWNQEKQGLHVFPIIQKVHPRERELIDLITLNTHGITTLIRARGNGHGTLYSQTKEAMQRLGKRRNVRVLHAKVNGEGDIVFFRIYEGLSKSPTTIPPHAPASAPLR